MGEILEKLKNHHVYLKLISLILLLLYFVLTWPNDVESVDTTGHNYSFFIGYLSASCLLLASIVGGLCCAYIFDESPKYQEYGMHGLILFIVGSSLLLELTRKQSTPADAFILNLSPKTQRILTFVFTGSILSVHIVDLILLCIDK